MSEETDILTQSLDEDREEVNTYNELTTISVLLRKLKSSYEKANLKWLNSNGGNWNLNIPIRKQYWNLLACQRHVALFAESYETTNPNPNPPVGDLSDNLLNDMDHFNGVYESSIWSQERESPFLTSHMGLTGTGEYVSTSNGANGDIRITDHLMKQAYSTYMSDRINGTEGFTSTSRNGSNNQFSNFYSSQSLPRLSNDSSSSSYFGSHLPRNPLLPLSTVDKAMLHRQLSIKKAEADAKAKEKLALYNKQREELEAQRIALAKAREADAEQLRLKIEAEKKIFAELVEKYKYEDPGRNFPNWLRCIKSYWNDVRRMNYTEAFLRHHGDDDSVSRDDNFDRDSLLSHYEVSDADETDDGIAAAIYGNQLQLDGFKSVADMLKLTSQDMYVSMSGLNSSQDQSRWSTTLGNPCYCYDDCPIPGWRREVIVRMSGKTRGQTETIYVAPGTGKRIRGKSELHTYFQTYGISLSLLPKFTYQNLFCVCHTVEDRSRSYLECSFGLAGCRQWLHSECVGLGCLREDQLRQMETVVCPLCTAYLEGTGEIDLFPNRRFLKFITLPSSSVTTAVNGFDVEAFTQPHKKWGLQQPLESILNGSAKHQYVNKDYSRWRELQNNQFLANGQKIQRDTSKPSTSSSLHVVSANGTNDDKSDHLVNNNTHLQIRLSSNGPLEDTLNAKPSKDMSLMKSPASNNSTAAAALPGIFQHRLFSGLGLSGNDEQSQSSGVIPTLLTLSTSPESDKEPPIITYDNDVLPADRYRYAKYDDGSVITVRLEGPSTRMKRKSESSQSDDMENRIVRKRLEIVDKSETSGLSLSLNQRYKRIIINHAISRTNISKRNEMDSGMVMLPVDDGGLRISVLNPSNLTEPYSCRSMNQYCIDHVYCGLCLETIDDEAKRVKSAKSIAIQKTKRSKSKSGKQSRKRVLQSTIIKQRIERLSQDNVEDIDSVELDDVHESSEVEEIHDSIEVSQSLFEGIVERTFGVVTYPLHNHCFAGFKEIIHDINLNQDGLYCYEDTYEYPAIDEGSCDLCHRSGGVLLNFEIRNNSPNASDNSHADSKPNRGHLPCIYFVIQSKIIFNQCNYTGNESCNISNRREVFESMRGIHLCSLCGQSSGLTYRCPGIFCTAYVHSLCAEFAKPIGWSIVELSSQDQNASTWACLCPIHAPAVSDD